MDEEENKQLLEINPKIKSKNIQFNTELVRKSKTKTVFGWVPMLHGKLL